MRAPYRSPIRSPASLVVAALVLTAAILAADQGQRPPVFRGGVDVVQLDVSVIDANRRPVHGLVAGDFTVFEDGVAQPIVGFEEFRIEDPPPPPVAWMRDVAPDVADNSLAESRLFVLVIDDALIPMDPRIIKDTKQIIRDVIGKLGPSDLTAVVFTADNRRTQDFTNDRARLLATADKLLPGLATYKFPPPPGAPQPPLPPGIRPDPNTDLYFFLSSISTLGRVADFLADIPNRRKAVIWISPGVPMDLAEAAALGPSAGPARDIVNKTEDVMTRAQRANVAIYGVDPSGLGGFEEYVARQNGESFPVGPISHRKAAMSLDFLHMAAASTGGRAIVNTNDFGPGIDQVFQENSSYYLLGYRPTNGRTDGTLRRLEVTVNRPGVEVRTRSSRYAPGPAKEDQRSAEAAALAKAVSGLLPDPDLPMQVTLAPFAVRTQRNPAVAIALGVHQPVPGGASGSRSTETTELLTSAFTPEGDARGSQRHTATVTLRAGADGEAHYEVLSRIDLAPGRYRLRLAAHNATSGKSGSVFADVLVPDFANDPISMSGVVLGVEPGRPSAPRDVLSSLLPFVPTAEREFVVTDRVRAFVRIYQSGRRPIVPIALAMTIRDGRGGTPVSDTRTIGLDAFPVPDSIDSASAGRATSRGFTPNQPGRDAFANPTLRSADVPFAIPLERLGPGPHVLTFEATAGATSIRRDVRFAVR